MKNLFFVFAGLLFGIVLTKSEVISWFRIRKMFLFEEPHMYLIIGSAVVVGAISVFILKKIKNNDVESPAKVYHKGFIIGGVIFGIGWAITGACPGPIFAQIGAGEYPALFSLAGALIGVLLYSKLKTKLPH